MSDKRTPPLPKHTGKWNDARERSAAQRYFQGTEPTRMALGKRLNERTPGERTRDDFGSWDSDKSLPNKSGQVDPRLKEPPSVKALKKK